MAITLTLPRAGYLEAVWDGGVGGLCEAGGWLLGPHSIFSIFIGLYPNSVLYLFNISFIGLEEKFDPGAFFSAGVSIFIDDVIIGEYIGKIRHDM